MNRAKDPFLFESATRPVSSHAEERLLVEPGCILGRRFEVLFKLGEGGMGQVFAAFDSVRRAQVAVKLLGERSPDSIALLKREFRAAVDIVHPNLVRLHELFSDAGQWFFSMEWIAGVTLPARLAQSSVRDAELVRRVVGQLALGVSALHRAGTLHGDLKPSNFLITEDEERVVLLDFGLARSSGPNQPLELSGTLFYMAPEQERAQQLTEAADWYSFGVVLYEALTGELPRREAAPALLADSPPDLAGLCLSLLRLEPRDRPTADVILACLGVSPQSSVSSIRPRVAATQTLFGREHELEALNQAYRATLYGAPALVLVHGPSGIGKTTLIEAFVRQLRAQDVLVLEGRCRERESIGYKAIDALIDAILARLDRLSPQEAAEILPPNVADLALLFPALRLASAITHAPSFRQDTSQHARVRLRAIEAFGELLARLRLVSPLVIWLDDLQWSDGESALLLGPVLGGSARTNLLFIASYRRDSESHGPLLDAMFASSRLQLPAASELRLDPLSEGAAERLAQSLLPAHGQQLARGIGREAGGHPLFISELSYAVERARSDRHAALPVTLVELVEERLAQLPEQARQLLELVAIAGEPVPRELLRHALLLEPEQTETALDELRAHRLVRSRGLRDADTIDSHHDRIREIVQQGIAEAKRRQYHLTLAQLLEAQPNTRPARLALHYEAAGQNARAGHYYAQAAERALHALAFAHAAELYAKAAALSDLDRLQLRALQIRRAQALAFAGRGPDAAELYLAQARDAGRDEALELQRLAAEQLLLAGHLDHGLAVIEGVLRALGMQPTRGGWRALLPLVAGRVLLDARGFRYTRRSERELSPAQRALLDAAWTTAWSLMFTDPIRAFEFQTRHMRLALRAGEPRRLLRALTLEAPSAAVGGARGQRRTAKLLAVAEQAAALTDDTSAHGLLSLARGACEYLQGRLESALELCLEALTRLGAQGSVAVWERMNAQRFVISTLFLLGRMPELQAFLSPLLAEVEDTRNFTGAAIFRSGYSTCAWLARDQLDEADRQLALAAEPLESSRFQLGEYSVLTGYSLRDLYAGEDERALERLRAAWPRVRAAQFLRIGVVRVQLTHLLGASAASVANKLAARGQLGKARALRREARGAARALSNEALPRARALGLSLTAALDCASGRAADSLRNLEACAAEFEAEHMQLFAAAAHCRIAEASSGSAARIARERAAAAFERQCVVKPARVAALLVPGFPD